MKLAVEQQWESIMASETYKHTKKYNENISQSIAGCED